MAAIPDAEEAELERQLAAARAQHADQQAARAARMRAMQAELAKLRQAGAATMPEEGGEAPATGRVTPPGREPGAFDFAMPTAKKRKPTPVQPSLPAALAAPFTVDVEQEPEGTLGDMALKVTAVAVDVDLKVTAVAVDGDPPMVLGPLGEHAAAVARALMGHADYDKAALLGFVKPQLAHLMAVLEIDQGRVGKLAAVGCQAEIGQPAVSCMLDGTRVSHGLQFTALAYKVAMLRWAEADITAAALGYEGELGKKKAAQPMAVALKPRWAGICDPVVWAIKERITKLGGELAPGASFPKRTEKDIKTIARNAWVAIKQDVDQGRADKDTLGAYNLGEEAFIAEAPKYIKEKWAKKAMKTLRDSFVKQQ